MGKTSHISKWEEGRPWLKPVKGKADKTHCSLCNKSFNIDKCGVSQVNAHSRGDNHQKLEKENLNQQKISISKFGEIKLTWKFVLTKEENVIKAETLNAFHYVEANIVTAVPQNSHYYTTKCFQILQLPNHLYRQFQKWLTS